ncbi:MAG: energy-coupling factor transporter transmembrane protein EcfT [Candidatus Nanopelagicales bacterium]|jgi:energy-coupling factor transport system permease protein|nr:energy-coupling factor transporter transmembrane protein EcfT [Candidatus Nanopelagicales bacterium]
MALPTTTRPGPAPAIGIGARLPRSLHPLAWWAWALGLLVAASRTTNPLILGLILGCLTVVVSARRPDAAWAGAFSAALRLGVLVIVTRTLLQLLLGAPVGLNVAFTLPEVALPEWMAGVRLGGLVTWESFLIGAVEGLRLAVMIACVGAANSLTPPSRLLRSVPAALYEVGVAVIVALTFAPHLLADARRVGAARRLRGHDEGRIAAFARSSGPVLDGGLERSIQLAAAMDSRGYGRAGQVTPRERRAQALLVLAGFAGVLIGLYGLFDSAAPRLLGWPMLAGGVLMSFLGVRAAGRRSPRTAYRPDRWSWPEWLTAGSGALAAVTFLAWSPTALLFQSTPLTWPGLLIAPAIAVLVAVGPAFWTPLPPGSGLPPRSTAGAPQ